MSFAFNVTIDAESAKSFAANGYVFAVQKATQGSTNAVQWLTVPVMAPAIAVNWETKYQVFFTATTIVNGAVINQTAYTRAYLGSGYTYKDATFLPTGSTGPDSVQITNGIAGFFNYGLSQEVVLPDGNKSFLPVAVASAVPALGNVVFTPSESVTVYFSNTNTSPGCVFTITTPSFTASLTVGTVPTFHYNKGIWSQSYQSSFSRYLAENGSFAGKATSKWALTLASANPGLYIVPFVQGKLGSAYNVTATTAGSQVILKILGPDTAAALTSLKGEQVSETSRTRVSEGYYKIDGSIDTIVDVAEIEDQETALIGYLLKQVAVRHEKA